MSDNNRTVFNTLSKININEHTDKKGGLTYLPWAWAWGKLLENYPDSTYEVYENIDSLNYHHDGNTAWVKTGVTVKGIELIEYLPIMDFKNNSIIKDRITSFDVNKAIQRSMTKAVARHGLGLYIYAGEDLPDGEIKTAKNPVKDPVNMVMVTPVDNTKAEAAAIIEQLTRDARRDTLCTLLMENPSLDNVAFPLSPKIKTLGQFADWAGQNQESGKIQTFENAIREARKFNKTQ